MTFFPHLWNMQINFFWKDIEVSTLKNYQSQMKPLNFNLRRNELFLSKFFWRKNKEINANKNFYAIKTQSPVLTDKSIKKMSEFYDIPPNNISIENEISHFAMLDPKWETIAKKILEKINYL